MNANTSPFMRYPSDSNDLQVIFHPHQSSWMIVNPTASEIIDKLADGQGFEIITQSLVENYEITKEQALEDILSVNETLHEKGFDIKDINTHSQRIPSLNSLFVHITRHCNLHCPHCYVTATQTPDHLSIETIIKLIDTLVLNGGSGITISGGEPLIHPDIDRILSHASSQGLTVRLLTNGTVIDRSMAKFLSDQNIYVQISLDGASARIHDSIRGPGTFEKVVKAIHLLQDCGAGNHLNLCTTLMQRNKDDWPQLIVFAEKNNIPLLRFLHLREVGRGTSHPDARPLTGSAYESFIAHITNQRQSHQKLELTCGMSGLLLNMPESFKNDDIWCPVGRMMVVDTTGDLYPCVLMMRDNFRLGNIHENALMDVLQSQKMINTCQMLANRRFLIKKCAQCLFKNLCQAGCMGQALDHCDQLIDTDIFCSYRQKAYFKAFDRLIAMAMHGNS